MGSVTLCLALCLSAAGGAADEQCGDSVDKALFSAKSWSDLALWFKRYPECDDGYMAEHVSTLVGEWLSSDSEQLASLAGVAKE